MATLVCLCVLRDFHFLKRVCSHTQGCILYEYTLLKQEGKLIFFCQEKLWANRKRFWGSGFTRITIGFPEVSEWETTREREEIWDEEREKNVCEKQKKRYYVCVWAQGSELSITEHLNTVWHVWVSWCAAVGLSGCWSHLTSCDRNGMSWAQITFSRLAISVYRVLESEREAEAERKQK